MQKIRNSNVRVRRISNEGGRKRRSLLPEPTQLLHDVRVCTFEIFDPARYVCGGRGRGGVCNARQLINVRCGSGQ